MIKIARLDDYDFIQSLKDLLACFERVGIELRDEIDVYFKRFNKLK